MSIHVQKYALQEVLSINVSDWAPAFGMSLEARIVIAEDMRFVCSRSGRTHWSQTDFCVELARLANYQPLVANVEAFIGYAFLVAYNLELRWEASKNEQASTPEKARRTEYERVYDELGKLFDETADEFVKQYDGKCRSFTHILRTRLVTDAIGYFSSRICGEECPNSDWTKAVAVVLDKNVVHCARTRTCTLFQPIISGDTP